MSQEFIETMRRTASNPLEFDRMLAQWNEAFEQSGGAAVTPAAELAADQALLEIHAREENLLIGGRLRSLVQQLQHVAFVVDSDGYVTGTNAAAMRQTQLRPGDSIDDLHFQLENAEPLTALIRGCLQGRNSAGDIALRRAYHAANDRSVSIAVLPSLTMPAHPSALVFVIDPLWRREVIALVARAYQLTPAETAVLTEFLDGTSLPNIATQRGTSLVTVRTQFQRLMEKTGAHSQAELMRDTLAFGQFMTDMAQISAIAGHPNRKQFDIVRPGGRSLDVTLAGDMTGKPVIFLSTLTHHTFPAPIEAQLAQNGILAIHIWRQGMGRTDPFAPGHDFNLEMAGDILAPLDSLKLSSAPIICFNGSLVDVLRSSRHLQSRVPQIISYSSFLPLGVRKGKSLGVPWALACSRAVRLSPTILRMMIVSGSKAWQAMGSRRFAQLQLGASLRDLESIDAPGVTQELESAFLGSIAQGIEENCRTMHDAFGEWTHEFGRCTIPIVVVHGDDDPCTQLDDVRNFITATEHNINLVEAPGAGYLASFQRPDILIETVLLAHTQLPRPSKTTLLESHCPSHLSLKEL